ncbi:MAG: serine hydrolase domain-containing protein [Nocardioides sp.]|uniref:serine hydrolase domain-containing protein n=1 Tax=Nocardioides sp. TaxID=35761 RepID=UPI003267121C
MAQRIEEQLNAYEGVATGAIVLVRMGDQTRTFTSGMADVKHRRRMRPDDRFPVMSITKTMVATAVLQLVATRRLSLNDTVKDVVPGLLPQGHRITMRDLLSHRAGLYDPRDEDLPALSRMTDDSLIEVSADHPLEFRPGTSGSYSNVGYEVLGKVVEQVTGEPLGDAMEHNIFDPAGMSDTQLLGSPSVQGYYDSKAAPDPYVRFIPAAGGVVSTVGDVDRFYTALSRGDLLDEDLVATMTTPLGTIEPFNVDYGLGVWFDRESCGVAWGHSGAGPGFATKAWTLPDANLSVVVMVNDGDGHTIADGFATAALCD